MSYSCRPKTLLNAPPRPRAICPKTADRSELCQSEAGRSRCQQTHTGLSILELPQATERNSFFENWHSAFHLLIWGCVDLERNKSFLSCMISVIAGLVSYLRPQYLTLIQICQIVEWILHFLVSGLGHRSTPSLLAFVCISEVSSVSSSFAGCYWHS